MAVAQFEQGILGGAVLPRFGLFGLGVEFQVVKEHLAHLCRRCGVEAHACQFVAFGLELVHLFGECDGVLAEGFHVNAGASQFHAGQHAHEGQLDVGHQFFQPLLLECLVEHIGQLQGQVGGFTGPARQCLGRHLLRRQLVTSFGAQQALGRDGGIVQQFVGHFGDGMAAFGLQQVVGDRGVIVGRRKADAVPVQGDHCALDVAAHDACSAAEQRCQRLEHVGFVVALDEGGLMWLGAQSDAHHLELHGVAAGAQQAHGDAWLVQQVAHQRGGLEGSGDQAVVMGNICERQVTRCCGYRRLLLGVV